MSTRCAIQASEGKTSCSIEWRHEWQTFEFATRSFFVSDATLSIDYQQNKQTPLYRAVKEIPLEKNGKQRCRSLNVSVLALRINL